MQTPPHPCCPLGFIARFAFNSIAMRLNPCANRQRSAAIRAGACRMHIPSWAARPRIRYPQSDSTIDWNCRIRMQDDYFTLMQTRSRRTLAEQIEHRALVLERDGRAAAGGQAACWRAGSTCRNARYGPLPRRLKDNGLIVLGAAGMALTPGGGRYSSGGTALQPRAARADEDGNGAVQAPACTPGLCRAQATPTAIPMCCTRWAGLPRASCATFPEKRRHARGDRRADDAGARAYAVPAVRR